MKRSTKLASIGLNVFKEQLPVIIPKVATLFPSSPSVSFDYVLPLSNSLLVQDTLPVEVDLLSATKAQKRTVPRAVEVSLAERLRQNRYLVGAPTGETFYERNLNAQTVQNQLNWVTNTLVQQGDVSPANVYSAANFGELQFRATIRKPMNTNTNTSTNEMTIEDFWFQLWGCADFSLTSSGILPATSTTPDVAYDALQETQLTHFAQRVFEDGESFVGVKLFHNAKPRFACGFNMYSYPYGYSNNLRYPAMNLCIEYKKDLHKKMPADKDYFVGQCGLYLVASSVAYSYITNNDQPFTTLGIVSDGNYYTFLAFQLNTLDFGATSKIKNIFWRKEMQLFKEYNSLQGFNAETLLQLKNVVAYSLKSHGKHTRKKKLVK